MVMSPREMTNTETKQVRTIRDKLIKRLSMYWQVEFLNIFLLPLCLWILAFKSGQSLGVSTFFNFIPMCGLLLVGALYWRAKLRHLQGNRNAVAGALKSIAAVQLPLLLLTIVAAGISVATFVVPGFAWSSADKWIALVVLILGVLEYVNYYHRQLQHFDHWPDLKRLCSGKGFRKSGLRADLERLGYRTRKSG